MNLLYNETSIDQDNSPSVEDYRAHAEHLKDIADCIKYQTGRQESRKESMDNWANMFGTLVSPTYQKWQREYEIGELALKRWKNYYSNESTKLERP